jgi:HAD superfamily hydrolase (TIGR01450 family)
MSELNLVDKFIQSMWIQVILIVLICVIGIDSYRSNQPAEHLLGKGALYLQRTRCRMIAETITSTGLRDIIPRYEVYLIDQWGVLHDGSKPYEGVLDALACMKSLDKKMILLSNSSKRKESSVKGLKKLGIDPSLFIEIVTSGELAWQALHSRSSLLTKLNIPINLTSSSAPLKVFVLGNGDDDKEYIRTSNCAAAIPEEADFVLARGTFSILCDERADDSSDSIVYKNSRECLSNLEPWLARCAKRSLPMIVSNPDMNRPGTNDPMPGQIAHAYSLLNPNSKILYIGKPHDIVYDYSVEALCSALGTDAGNLKLCAIGDSLEHDIEGANRRNFASIFIANGVHCADLQTKEGSSMIPAVDLLDRLIERYDVRPTHTISRFEL